MSGTATAVVCGLAALFGLVGLICLGARRRRGDEFALADGAQDFDDEDEPRSLDEIHDEVFYGPKGGASRPWTDEELATYVKVRDAEIAELNAAELPGLIRLRNELRQLPEFQAKHSRVLRYDLYGAAFYDCECGQPWPCARLVGRVWEGAE